MRTHVVMCVTLRVPTPTLDTVFHGECLLFLYKSSREHDACAKVDVFLDEKPHFLFSYTDELYITHIVAQFSNRSPDMCKSRLRRSNDQDSTERKLNWELTSSHNLQLQHSVPEIMC